MKLVIFGVALLCVSSSLCAKEEVSKKKVTAESKKPAADKQTDKRGIAEIIHTSDTGGYAGDYHHDNYELGGAQSLGLLGYGASVPTSRITSIIINKEVQVPIPKPYPVHVEKRVPYPVPHPVPVPVVKHYPVPVPQPYPVPIEKKVPYPVEKVVPYPVKVPYQVPYPVPHPVHVPKPVPVPVHVPKPVPVPHPVVVKKPVPVYVDSHDFLGDIYSNGEHGGFGLEYFGEHHH